MAITLRSVKGSALTHEELDANFTTLDSEKLSAADAGEITDTKASPTGADQLFIRDSADSNAVKFIDIEDLPVVAPADGSITLAKLANLAQDQFIGRTTASTGVPETATITAAARTVLDDTTVAAMVNTLGGATSTGTGGIARATSPTFVTPVLGTPSSGTLTNCTGLPTAGMVDASVTLAKMANLAQDQFIGRTTASTGVPQTTTITAAARTVLDDATVGDMRTTLSAAARAQTGMIPIFIRTVADETLRLIINTPVALTITNITTRSASGTCTVTGQIDGTPLGGTANSASSTEQSQAHASANAMSAGSDFLLAFSSNSACTGLAVNVHYTYNQA